MQINAYITPPENQGFAAHYDTHDVFVLQVSGSKRWTDPFAGDRGSAAQPDLGAAQIRGSGPSELSRR